MLAQPSVCKLSHVRRHSHEWAKSHLAQALAHEACVQGFNVLFVQTHKMLQQIHGGRADDTRDRRLQSYLRPDLLVLDDFGLRPFCHPALRTYTMSLTGGTSGAAFCSPVIARPMSGLSCLVIRY